MATYAQIFARSQDANLNAQIAVAIAKEAKYKLGTSTDEKELDWATYAAGSPRVEGAKWQLTIATDPAIADAVEPTDENVQAAVGALVPVMVKSWAASKPAAPTGLVIRPTASVTEGGTA